MRFPKSREERLVQKHERASFSQLKTRDEIKDWPLAVIGPTLVEEWRLMKTCEGGLHLVGRFLPNGRFNASLPLASLDLSSRSVVTQNGKRLRIQGEPGCAAVGRYVASLYGVFDRRLHAAQDVTAAFVVLTSRS